LAGALDGAQTPLAHWCPPVVDARPPHPRVLWAGSNPPDLPAPATITVVREPDLAAARRRAATETFAAVVVDADDLEAVAAVLGAALTNPHAALRIAAATYGDIVGLVREIDDGVIERVLPKPVTGPRLVDAVTPEAWSRPVAPEPLTSANGSEPPRADDRLRGLIERVVDEPGVVIRPLAPGDHVPRLQLVVRDTASWHELRARLPAWLGAPLKAGGAAMPRAYRSHPLHRILGSLSPSQEVYSLGGPPLAYVALFPWGDAPKVTVVIGHAPPDGDHIADLHAHAVAHAHEFPLPTPQPHAGDIRYDPDYDWVITRDYVGPDRRRTSTSFLNRYTFRGRRRALMPNEFSTPGTFVDIAPRWAWIGAGVFAGLFLFDTAMTASYVRAGTVGELNPVMRWALGRSPVLFWTMKSAMVLVATFIVMRWHVWKPGRWLFAACLAVYAVLDAYWLLLVVTATVS
jgi:hypothetical protein